MNRKYELARHQFFNWLFAFVDIFDALVTIFTFAYICPQKGLKARIWKCKIDVRRRKERVK